MEGWALREEGLDDKQRDCIVHGTRPHIYRYTLCSNNLLLQVLASPTAGQYRGRILCYKQRTDGETEVPEKVLVLLVDYGKETVVRITLTTWTWT